MSTYTADDLAKIKGYVASGASSGMIAGEAITFRSLADMLRIQGLIEAEVGGSSAPTVMPVRYATTSRGL